MRRRYLVLLAVLAFAATLVLHAPAPTLYAWTVGKAEGSARLHGLHGTLVSGGFAALTVEGRPVLTDARWRLHPAWLLFMRLSADVEATGDSVVRARVSRSVFGALRLTPLQAAGSVKGLLGLVGQAHLPVEGQVRLDFPQLRVDQGLPIAAEGTADFQNLVWTMARNPLPLGSFVATLSTDDKGVLVTLDAGPGPLELDGTITLGPERTYEAQVRMRARPDAGPSLQSLLRSLGQPDAQGWYHVRRSGTLP